MYEYIYSSDVLPTPTAVSTAEEGIAVPAIVWAGYGSSMNSLSLVLSSQFWCVGDTIFEDKRRNYCCNFTYWRDTSRNCDPARNTSSSRSGGSQRTTEMLWFVAVCCVLPWCGGIARPFSDNVFWLRALYQKKLSENALSEMAVSDSVRSGFWGFIRNGHSWQAISDKTISNTILTDAFLWVKIKIIVFSEAWLDGPSHIIYLGIYTYVRAHLQQWCVTHTYSS